MVDFRGRLVVVIGGGTVGLRKARILLRAGARVRVVSREFVKGFDRLAVGRAHTAGGFNPGSIRGAWFVVAATRDRALNARIAQACEARGILCNVVDDPQSRVYTTSSFTRGPFTIGVSTQGVSPALAGRMRRKIESLVGPEWTGMAQLQGSVRAQLQKEGRTSRTKRRVLLGILEDEEVWKKLRDRDAAGARGIVRSRHLEGRNAARA